MQFFATQKKKSSAAVFIDYECLPVSAFESNNARERGKTVYESRMIGIYIKVQR